MPDLSDFQPDFSTGLGKLENLLNQRGIKWNIVSGYRSPEYQNQMYQNHLAKQAGQPLPYPNVEAPGVVAPPWKSFHNYGIAADFNLPGGEYQTLQQIAPQAGLSGIGMSDPGHIQLGGSLADDIAQYHLAGWRPAGAPAPATGAVAYAGQPSRIATATPGKTLNSSPLDIVLQAESGDRNINNTTQGTSSGQAQGNLQITTGTWNDFAPKAGVDLKKYPTPDSAPRDVQIAVGNTIPLNRWAQSTVNKVLAQYPGIDTSQPLGAIQSAAINPSATPAPATPSVGNAIASLTQQAGDSDLAKTMTQQPKPQGGGGPDQGQAMQMQQMASAGNPRQQLIQMQAQQLAAQLQQRAQQPLSWGTAPYGSGAGLVPTVPMAGQMPPGVTLNSMGGQLV